MPNLLATLGQQYEIIAGTGIAENKVYTFDGSSSGSIGAHKLFNVTGLVAVKIYCFCQEPVITTASGTVEVGTSTSTAGLVAQVAAGSIIANEIWHDATPDQSLELSSVSTEKIITKDIILTVATGAVSAGKLYFTCTWKPLSDGAIVTAASANSSASASASPSSSLSPSSSASHSLSPSSSASLSLSPSNSASPSSSVSSSFSASLSPSSSASRSLSPSSSASASLSPSSSVSPSSSASLSASPSSSASASLSPSSSASRSASPSSSTSPSLSPSPL